MSEEPSYDIVAWRADSRGYSEEMKWTGVDRFERDMIEIKLRLQAFEFSVTPRWPFGVGFYEDWDYE